jgi:hypothetical protein
MILYVTRKNENCSIINRIENLHARAFVGGKKNCKLFKMTKQA